MTIKTSLLGGAALGVVIACGLAAPAAAQDTTIAWKGAPQFQNDTLTFKVRGRVYLDYVYQDVDREVETPTLKDFKSSQSRVRTARLGVEGTWNANWGYKVEAAISSGGGSTQWEDVILEYKPNDYTSIMVGNFKTLSFENVSSSRYTTMMERGAFNDLIDAGRVMHVAAKVNGENWTVTGAISGDSINSADLPANNNNSFETFGVNARATWVPINAETNKLHVGAWARYREKNDSSATGFTYQVRNNTNFGARYVSTGSIGHNDVQIGAEALWIYKQFSVQGEYAHIDVDRNNNLNADLDGFYVTASWFPTGEMKNLDVKRGELGRTKILEPMTAGGMGAVELAVRYDNVDLGTTGIATAGKYEGLTFGATWYPHPYVRFMANYTRSNNENVGNNNDIDVDTFQMRAQFDF